MRVGRRIGLGIAMVQVVGASCVAAATGGAAAPLIGVYDVKAAHGMGPTVEGLVKGLRDDGHAVQAFNHLGLLSLLPFDIVILPGMHKPGLAPEAWRENLDAYVRAGGSILQTWHHHILSEVSVGIKRVYGQRRMVVKPGHPAVAGLSDFDAGFQDHIVERVGPGGTVILENIRGEPVAAAGQIGKGRVISTGLALAIPNGQATRPARGAEKALLESFLAWLTPAVSRTERWGALGTQWRVELTPEVLMGAAGLPLTARLVVGPVPPGAEPTVFLDSQALPVPESDAAPIRTVELRLVAAPGRQTESEHVITVRLGDEEQQRRLAVHGRFAPAPPDETRAVWLHVGMDRHPERVMPELKRLGVNAVVPRIAGGTAAFFASQVQPDVQDPLAEGGGDWLAEILKHARANGIAVHPYVNNCIVEGRTSPESLERLRREGRLQQSSEGDEIAWFCPSHPENVAAITRPMVEIAGRYDIAGIQYDFIRYPNPRGCFCPRCRACFEAATGKPVAEWPREVLAGGPSFDAWVAFRCDRISAIVEHVSREVRRVNGTARISAAVFHNWPQCRVEVGQDWVRWCREGWLDLVFPMTYTQDPREYERLVREHRAALPAGFPVVEGIGINSGMGTMTDPGRVALHVVLARAAGAAGWCGFCYTPDQTAALLEPLADWLRDAASPR